MWVFKNMVICKNVVSKGWCKESKSLLILLQIKDRDQSERNWSLSTCTIDI